MMPTLLQPPRAPPRRVKNLPNCTLDVDSLVGADHSSCHPASSLPQKPKGAERLIRLGTKQSPLPKDSWSGGPPALSKLVLIATHLLLSLSDHRSALHSAPLTSRLTLVITIIINDITLQLPSPVA